MAVSGRLKQQFEQFIKDKCKEAHNRCDKIEIKEYENYLRYLYMTKIIENSNGVSEEPVGEENQFREITTWVGLDNYNKDWADADSSIDLFPIYKELVKLKIVNENVLDIISEIAGRGLNQNDINTVHIVVHHLGEEPTVNVYVGVGKNVDIIASAAIAFSDEESLAIESYLSRDDLDENVYNYICILWAQIILKNGLSKQTLEEVMRLSFFRSNAVFREWLCKYICSEFVNDEDLGKIVLDLYIPVITEGIIDKKYSQMLLAVSLYKKKNYLEAYKKCSAVANLDIPSTFEITFLLDCSLNLRMFASIEMLTKKFISEARNYTPILKLIKYSFLSAASQKKYANAVDVARELPLNSLELSELVLLARCYIECGKSARFLFNRIRSMSAHYYAQLKALVFLNQKKYIDVLTLLDRNIIDPVSFFYIGKAYWHLGEFPMCYNFLIKAVTYDTEYADAYHLLGLYYEEYALKSDTAIDYFEKAVKCNGSDPQNIKALSDMYTIYNNHDGNFALLNRAYHYVGDLPWVNFRIGLYFFYRNNLSEAALKFAKAISYSYEIDGKYYEFLARCYQGMGFPRSAILIIRELIKLCPQLRKNYLCFIGDILTENENYDEALRVYEQVLKIDYNYLPALEACAVTWLKRAEHQLTLGFYRNARCAAQVAVEYYVYLLDSIHHNRSYWTELAKTLTFIASLPDVFCYVEIPFDRTDDLGYLGFIYMKRSIYKLIYYCTWRSRSDLAPLLDRLIGRKVAAEILRDEAFSGANQGRHVDVLWI